MSMNLPSVLVQESNEEYQSSKRSKDARRRIFGVLREDETLQDIGLFWKMAYRAQSGINYSEKSEQKILDGMRSQLYWWRGLEVLVCEGLILHWNGFHFLPPKELDVKYKIDMCSRRSYRDIQWALKTFCIGTQLTVAEIPNNITHKSHWESEHKWHNPLKYQQKFDQIKAITPFLHNHITRQNIKKEYGKLSLPDIICYIAVNGELRRTLWNTSGYTYMKYREWKIAWYDSHTLAERFKEHIKNLLSKVVDFIDWTQSFIHSEVFIKKVWDKWNAASVTFTTDSGYVVDYSKEWQTLTFLLYRDNREILCKATYFFCEDDLQKIARKSLLQK